MRRRAWGPRLALATALALTVAAPIGAVVPAPTSPGPGRVASSEHLAESVLAISIDGLNPQALRRLGRVGAPHLHRFVRKGAATLNARTEYEMTVTLPNHTGMVTGRRVFATQGGHGVTWNEDRRQPATVHEAAGEGVASVFSVVAESGGSSAVFASKEKFSLWKRTWGSDIDRFTVKTGNKALVEALRRDVRDRDRALRFLHLSLPDVVGHDEGFMSPAYLDAVARVDRLVGRAVRSVTADRTLRRTTAIMLTSDHGGLGHRHSAMRRRANYRVPFMVRGPGIAAGANLYDLNPDYANPHRGRPTYDEELQPVRNGMVANLALDLLGLGPVPGSEHNVLQDLDVTEP